MPRVYHFVRMYSTKCSQTPWSRCCSDAIICASFLVTLHMKLHHLRDFLAIVDRGSISAAAKFLGIAQPSLSRSIRELEKELGVPLVERQARGAVLTEMGVLFARRARLAVNELQKGRDELTQGGGQTHGTVSACLSSVALVTLLTEALSPFRTRYPFVKLNLMEGVYPLIESRLKDGTLDVYVGAAPDTNVPHELAIERLFHPPRAVLARRGHPLEEATSLAQLLDADWLTTSITDRSESEFGAVFERHGLQAPRLSMRTSSALASLTALINSDVLTITSQTLVDMPPYDKLVSVIPVKEVLSSPPIVLVHRAAVPPTPAAEYFCDMIRRVAVKQDRHYPSRL